MLERPTEALMRKLLLLGVLGTAATVLVRRGDGRVVVPRDAGDSGALEHRDDFIRPGRVADQIAQVVDPGELSFRLRVAQYGVERRAIRMDVGEKEVAHWRRQVSKARMPEPSRAPRPRLAPH